MHPHTGEAGAIGAAMETLRVVKRKGNSTFIGIDAAIDLEYTTKNDEETVCHFCPNECKRTFIDTKRPDGSTSRYIAGFSCEKGTVEIERGDARARRRAEEDRRSSSRTWSTTRRSARSCTSTTPAPMPADGAPIKDVEVQEGHLRHAARRGHAPVPALLEGELGRAAGACASASRACSTCTRRRRASGRTSRRSASRSRTSSSATRPPKRCGSRAASTGRSTRATRRKVAQAHIHNLLFHAHAPAEKKPLKYIFFPILTHVNNFVADTMDNASCPIVAGAPDVMKAAFTKEVDFFATRGIEYLDPALSFVEPTLMARRMFETFGPRLGITEDENDLRLQGGVEGARQPSTRTSQEKGRAILETVEAEDRVAILMIGRPYHSDPGPEPRHPRGVPGPRLSDPVASARSRRTASTSIATTRKSSTRGSSRRRSSSTTCGRRTTRSTARRRCGRRASRRTTRTSWCSTSRRSSAATTRRPTASSTPSSRRARRRTRRSTTSTPTSRAGSIKIRVKTYAHALKLHEERLRTRASASGELVHAIDQKRLELLELRTRAARGAQASATRRSTRRSRSCALASDGLRGPRPRRRKPSAPNGGIVKLGKKDAPTGVVRVRTILERRRVSIGENVQHTETSSVIEARRRSRSSTSTPS